jgi:hypothetical protein
VLDSINYDAVLLYERLESVPKSITDPTSTIVSSINSSDELLTPLVNACIEIHADARRITTVHAQTTGSEIRVGFAEFQIFLKTIRSVTRKVRAEAIAKFFTIKFFLFLFMILFLDVYGLRRLFCVLQR